MTEIVGRGELKLAEAVKALRVNFDGKTVLDIGSSTGGFTELALRKGARKVIAVEKGTRQMKLPLRVDSRVELHEKTDIFEFRTAERIDLVLADVSFVSLTRVLKYVQGNFGGRAGAMQYLVMLKPQFEAYPDELNRGVVKNERMRRNIIKRFEEWLRQNGFVVQGKHDNETTGKNGNRERFYLLAAK